MDKTNTHTKQTQNTLCVGGILCVGRNGEMKMNSDYVRTIKRTVTVQNAQLCSCKFPIEDKYGKYDGYRPHNNWELHKQDHSDPNFAHYIKCSGCGYELAKKYWTQDGGTVDYINPEGSINHIDPDDIDDLPEESSCGNCDGKGYFLNVFNCETHLHETQRCDRCKVFKSDEEARQSIKTYRVKATKEVYYYIDVKAKNDEEAYDIASDSDRIDFTYEDAEWVIEPQVPEEVK